MHAAQRRQAILDVLRQSGGPVSASALAERFSVSRQWETLPCCVPPGLRSLPRPVAM